MLRFGPLEAVRRDARHALRTLRSTRAWTAAAILSLALGIGSSTALFAVFYHYALGHPPVANPDELVTLRWSGAPPNERRASYHYAHIAGGDVSRGGHTFPFDIVEQLRHAGRSSFDLFAFAPSGPLNVFADGRAEFVTGQFVSGNFYSSLGVEADEGRMIRPHDDDDSADPVAVISHQYRVRRYGTDGSVVGGAIRINGMPFTIVGVSPADLPDFMARGLPDAPDVSIPLGIEPRLRGPASLLRSPSTWWLAVMARLKPAVRRETVEAKLDLAFRQAARPAAQAPTVRSPPLPPPRLHVVSARHGVSDVSRHTITRIAIVAGMLGAVLLIVCVNVATLLLSRGAMRQREFAVRAALGASRTRLTAQLLVESLVLAGIGGAVGLLATVWLSLWSTSLPLRLPADATILTPPVLVFAALLIFIAALLFGAGPALHATRLASAPPAKRDAGTWSSSHKRLGRSLIAVQVALTVFLLVGAGLFLRTLSNLQQTYLGFDPANVLLFTLRPELSGYDGPQAASLYHRMNDRLSSMPGIRSVSSATIGGTLLDGGGIRIRIELAGRTDRPEAHMLSVDHDFFETLRIPLLSGRGFSPDDTPGSQPVALVNQAFANAFFRGSPIGQRFRGGPREVQVIGVVGDAKVNTIRDAAPPTFYLPATQLSRPARSVLVRTTGPPRAAVSAVESAMREIDPQLPLGNVTTLVDRIGANHLSSERGMAVVSSAFGALALLTAMVGLFGLTSHNVVRRLKEIGIRMALGATRRDVLGSVMKEVLTTVGLGLAVGLAAASALNRLVESQLFELAGHDPATMLSAVVVTLAASLPAGYLPARRAAGVDPVTAIRCD